MPITKLEYRIFLSCPTGLQSEEDILKREIQEYNRLHGGSGDPSFRLVSWDQVPPGVGRPQARINKDLVQADYLLLVLHDRWGSTTGEGGYPSGSLEELAIALECLRSPDLPMRNIAIFFKKVSPRQLADPGRQLSQVLQFKQALTDGREVLYKLCGSKEVFRRDVRGLLSEWARECNSLKASRELPAIREWVEAERRGSSPTKVLTDTIEAASSDDGHTGTSKDPDAISLEEEDPSGLLPWVANSGTAFVAKRRNGGRIRSLTRQFLPYALAASLLVALLIDIMGRLPPSSGVPRLATVVDLVPSGTRGESAQVVDVKPTSDIVLIPAFFEERSFDSYSFEIIQEGRSLATWNGIPASRMDQLSILLPRSTLPAGNISARLYGISSSEKHLIQEFDFEVRYH